MNVHWKYVGMMPISAFCVEFDDGKKYPLLLSDRVSISCRNSVLAESRNRLTALHKIHI